MVNMEYAKVDAKLVALWTKERDEVVKTYDVEKFKDFYRKYQLLGVYPSEIRLPKDAVIEVSLRKMVYHTKSATRKEKAEAEKWLKERGYSTDM